MPFEAHCVPAPAPEESAGRGRPSIAAGAGSWRSWPLRSDSVFLWLAISLGGALTNPALGSSMGARAAEWFRGHGGASIVVWAENEWYSHHQPKVGGTLAAGTIRKPKEVPSTTARRRGAASADALVPSCPSPAHPLRAKANGRRSGARVDGVPGSLRDHAPSGRHPHELRGGRGVDGHRALEGHALLGQPDPGGGPYSHTAPISPTDANQTRRRVQRGILDVRCQWRLLHRQQDRRAVADGAASFVVYKNGSSTVGQWGRDVTMGPNVVSVRQNLDLLVDNGQVVPAASSTNTRQWGATLGGGLYVWRSGLGVTADGALVYVGGPGLDILDLATILQRAGAVRAMELDINTDWVNFSSYQPSLASGPATPATAPSSLPAMTGTPGRYFQPWWARDFITHVRRRLARDVVRQVQKRRRRPSALKGGAQSDRAPAGGRVPFASSWAHVPKQWLKNLLVFMAPAAAGVLGEWHTTTR